MAKVWLARDDGAEFAFGDIFRITSYGLTGTGHLEVEIFTENKAVGDGDIITGQRLPSREIRIESVCITKAGNEIARRVANAFFNPIYEYELHLEYKDQKRWVPCLLSIYDLPTENTHRPQALTVAFLCPDPLFLSEDSFGHNIASIMPRHGFPYMCHPVYGTLASVFNFGQSVVIQNDGDVATWPRVKITARGHVENPSIIKDELFVRIQDTMDMGDEIVVDFTRKTVHKNGVNIVQKLSKDSSLTSIAFQVGTNVIGYAADDGENVMNVFVDVYKRYTGV